MIWVTTYLLIGLAYGSAYALYFVITTPKEAVNDTELSRNQAMGVAVALFIALGIFIWPVSLYVTIKRAVQGKTDDEEDEEDEEGR